MHDLQSIQNAIRGRTMDNRETQLPHIQEAERLLDSITDGRGSTTNLNNRWPDLLVPRLLSRPQTSQISVINQAAGGNRILNDGLGPNTLARLDRDVLAQGGVEYAMIFEGVNDIGTAATDATTQKTVGDRLISAFKQITTRLRTADITASHTATRNAKILVRE
ncbi:hypothetical protein M7I_7283 [Glarea lozoyensis 74030]|uniref:Uncharacterized protein n=1 Tax=Glarea lozoyensis (strain ATCC 74030 / MF5533) TaxID=1104152 RepID=H0EWV8_GLAL7|nr:hypothetical protein M7I_7283 [Glarea lozoyensis 74030]